MHSPDLAPPDTKPPAARARTNRLSIAGGSVEERRRALRRARTFATSLLVLMLVIFVATSIYVRQWPWLAYLRAFAEAGMIGACADWFAVVALFRHPLGIPIPHTAIVASSKERIGVAIGRFMANNFLSPRVLAERIRDVDIGGWAGRWLLRGDNAGNVARRITSSLNQALSAIPREDLNAFLSGAVRGGIERVPASAFASRLLSLLWAHGEMQALAEKLLDWASTALANNRETIRAKVSKRTSRLIPKWIDGIVADKIIDGLTRTLDEMREPSHPWRIEMTSTVEQLIGDLATRPELIEKGEELKARMLAAPAVISQIDGLWVSIENRLEAEDTQAQLTRLIERLLTGLGTRIQNDEQFRLGINRWLRVAVLRTVAPRRKEIAEFIRKVVENWDTETLTERIELTVGRDLQYIRINGTIVGGLVGLVIFAVTQLL
ncbi:MAG TPA: DUF445 domain-containing protein [Bradyrhizobium sp.]|uniref:DUF445 domain-containing protein n=1 Tax=Bradyrhizobium sp. TaxID=376 RepID=UPI002D7EF254|nr:DUF445 domain-containing protein [Bradyrhizobium sp.]HET7884612.1 DUF445 domain-containing protein [Bradyrhizobium sp.]